MARKAKHVGQAFSTQHNQKTKKNIRWSHADWPARARELIATGTVRHIGDLLLRLGIPIRTHGSWCGRGNGATTMAAKPGWQEATRELPCPPRHGRLFLPFVSHATHARFRELVAEGLHVHDAADQAIAEAGVARKARNKAKRVHKWGPEEAKQRNDMTLAKLKERRPNYIPAASRAGTAILRQRVRALKARLDRWTTMQAMAHLLALPLDAVCEMYRTEEDRADARAILTEKRIERVKQEERAGVKLKAY